LKIARQRTVSVRLCAVFDRFHRVDNARDREQAEAASASRSRKRWSKRTAGP
jgi:hypothetical protein